MGQQVKFFTQKDAQLTFFLDYKNIYRAESTFDKGNIQHVKLHMLHIDYFQCRLCFMIRQRMSHTNAI